MIQIYCSNICRGRAITLKNIEKNKSSTRICRICQFEKPKTDFHTRPYIRNDVEYVLYRTACKICYRDERYPKYKQYNADRRASLRQSILHAYGNKCACCSENISEFLEVDHTYGDGRKHRDLVGENVYIEIVRENFPPDRYRLLCSNCNHASGRVNSHGICPHRKLEIEFIDSIIW